MFFQIMDKLFSEPGFPISFITCIALLIAEIVAERGIDHDE